MSYERGYTGASCAEVFFIEKPDARVNSPPPSHLLFNLYFTFAI